MGTTTASRANSLSDRQIASLMAKKIFFGHQSVGNNLLQGIEELQCADPRLKLNIVKSSEPHSTSGPAFVESEIGENGNPQSKIDAFIAVIDKGIGAQDGIALFKFCYVDIDASTDIPKMFAAYCNAIRTLKARYPFLKIVHATVPLTTVETASRAWIKSLLGKVTLRDLNGKRNQFNSLMRKTYAGTDPIFDLAGAESTHTDGSREGFTRNSETIFTLVPEFSSDGGHLNELGRRGAAEQLLLVLAEL